MTALPFAANRRAQDLRRTTISLARTDGGRKDLLELCTHTPKRENAIDVYTAFEWRDLCGEVAKLQIRRRARGRVVAMRAVGGTPADDEGCDSRDSDSPPEVRSDGGHLLADLSSFLSGHPAFQDDQVAHKSTKPVRQEV